MSYQVVLVTWLLINPVNTINVTPTPMSDLQSCIAAAKNIDERLIKPKQYPIKRAVCMIEVDNTK